MDGLQGKLLSRQLTPARGAEDHWHESHQATASDFVPARSKRLSIGRGSCSQRRCTRSRPETGQLGRRHSASNATDRFGRGGGAKAFAVSERGLRGAGGSSVLQRHGIVGALAGQSKRSQAGEALIPSHCRLRCRHDTFTRFVTVVGGRHGGRSGRQRQDGRDCF